LTSYPLLNSHTTILHIRPPWSPPSRQQGLSPKLEVSLESVVSDAAHSVASDLKELHQYFATRLLTPSNSTRSTQLPVDSQSCYFGLVTLCGWTLVTSKTHGLQRNWTTLPGTISGRRKGVMACILTWSVPGSVSHPPSVPCFTTATY